MPNFKKMYVKMAQASDEAVNLIKQGDSLYRQAAEKLMVARQLAEDMYTEADDTPIELAPGHEEAESQK